MLRVLRGVMALVLVLTLAGCSRASKQDMVKKIESAKSKEDVEKILGKADEYNSTQLGPLKQETLIYKASDGKVIVNFTPAGKVVATE